MTENIVNTPYHRQISLAKAGSVITQDKPVLDNVHLKLVRVNSVNRQQGLISITGANDHSVNGNRIKNTVEHIPLPVMNYGVNQDGNAYGTYPQVNVGDRVLLGFLSSNSADPIVLQIIPDASFLPHLSPAWSDDSGHNSNHLSTYRSQKEVFPSQQVELKKGNGDYERTLNGNSFIARFDPGQTHDRPWVKDAYTGILNSNDYGKPLEASIDHSTGQPYQIQTANAQDWVKIHQSNDGVDHHLTKRLVKSDGSIHNMLGNKLFKNDKLVENASLDKGYGLHHTSGKLNAKTPLRVKHLIKYAKEQINKHVYSSFNVNGNSFPVKSSKRGYDKYHGKLIKSSKWGFSNDIDYNPKHGTSNGLHFIYSILKECHFDVPNGCWSSDGMMHEYLRDNNPKVKSIKPGDIAFKCTYTPTHHERSIILVPKCTKPSLIIQKYHGAKTKCIAEYKSAGNVKQSTLGKLYDVGPHSNGSLETVSVVRPTKTITASANFKIHNTNTISLDVTDPKVNNWANQNVFNISATSSAWECMNHKIKIDKKGIYVDGKNIKDAHQQSQNKIDKLEKKNKDLSSKFSRLLKILKSKKIVPRDFK